MRARLPRPTITTAVAGALTLASITATAGFLLGRYDLLPMSIPVRFRGGRPDRFILKTYAMVFTPLWTQLILVVVIGGVALLLLWRAHGIDASDEDAAQDRDRMLHGAEAIALLGLVWISFQCVNAWSLTELWLRWAGGMGLAYEVALITAGVLSVLVGGRAMLKIGRPAARHTADDGRLWRFKALYFNPSNPALFVPARYGSGLTLNFGRPIAIAIMLAILLVGLGGPFLLARLLLR